MNWAFCSFDGVRQLAFWTVFEEIPRLCPPPKICSPCTCLPHGHFGSFWHTFVFKLPSLGTRSISTSHVAAMAPNIGTRSRKEAKTKWNQGKTPGKTSQTEQRLRNFPHLQSNWAPLLSTTLISSVGVPDLCPGRPSPGVPFLGFSDRDHGPSWLMIHGALKVKDG